MNLFAFLSYCVIVTFSPGPSNIIILSTVQHFGTKRALQFTFGSTIAFGLLLGASAILNHLFIDVLPNFLIVLQVIGTLYILYLAYQVIRMDLSNAASVKTGTFSTGFFMQFLNPKVVLFTFTVLPSYVFPYYNTKSEVALFVLGITFIGLCAFLTWVTFGTIFKSSLQKHAKLSNTLMAIFLVYSAIIIWI